MNKTYMTIALMSPLVCTAAMGAKLNTLYLFL